MAMKLSKKVDIYGTAMEIIPEEFEIRS